MKRPRHIDPDPVTALMTPPIGTAQLLATNSNYDGEDLLEWIEEARDGLELAPGDPAQDVFDAMGGQRKAKADVKLAEADAIGSIRPRSTSRRGSTTSPVALTRWAAGSRAGARARAGRTSCRITPARDLGADRRLAARASRPVAEDR
jgi:hypothetical protein